MSMFSFSIPLRFDGLQCDLQEASKCSSDERQSLAEHSPANRTSSGGLVELDIDPSPRGAECVELMEAKDDVCAGIKHVRKKRKSGPAAVRKLTFLRVPCGEIRP